jgi:hypothetical protein
MARQNRGDILDPNEVGCFHDVQRTIRRAWLQPQTLRSLDSACVRSCSSCSMFQPQRNAMR